MRTSSLALAAVLFLASQGSAQAQATYHQQAGGPNLTVLAATNGSGGYITADPYFTTGPNQYTEIAPFIGPLPPADMISTLWNSTYPLHSAISHGDYVTLYFAKACTVDFYDLTTVTYLTSASYAAGTYLTVSWGYTDTLRFNIAFNDGSQAFVDLDLY